MVLVPVSYHSVADVVALFSPFLSSSVRAAYRTRMDGANDSGVVNKPSKLETVWKHLVPQWMQNVAQKVVEKRLERVDCRIEEQAQAEIRRMHQLKMEHLIEAGDFVLPLEPRVFQLTLRSKMHIQYWRQ